MPTILIVEDNEDIRLNLVEYLESKNYQTDNTDDGLKALALTIVNKYDLIVLDIMLPGMDGLRLCRELRSRGNTTPIIILSAKDSTDDRIMGLSEGADDYIVKPFSLAELLLRIQAVLRRSSTPEEKVLQVGDLRLELDSKRVFRGDTELKLNPTAFRILAFLMQKSPEVVSREEIEDEIWGFQRVAGDNLRAHIYQIRKIVDKPFEEPLIETLTDSAGRYAQKRIWKNDKRSFAQTVIRNALRRDSSRLRGSVFHHVGLRFRDGREQAHGICDGRYAADCCDCRYPAGEAAAS